MRLINHSVYKKCIKKIGPSSTSQSAVAKLTEIPTSIGCSWSISGSPSSCGNNLSKLAPTPNSTEIRFN